MAAQGSYAVRYDAPAIPSERIQRQIDALLDQAEGAVSDGAWNVVVEKARAVLAFHPDNADALALIAAAVMDSQHPATGATAGRSEESRAETASALSAPVSAPPDAFAGGRYAVRRFLGEGGKKKVYLAHDSLLDRDVAFTLIKTEGLDATARERITREAQAMGRLGSHPHIVSIFDIGDPVRDALRCLRQGVIDCRDH